MDPLFLIPLIKNSFQNQSNIKATHTFPSRPLNFKLQQEVLKSNNICEKWSSLKTDMGTNFLNLENRSLRISVFPNSNL